MVHKYVRLSDCTTDMSSRCTFEAVADPGFPVGGCRHRRGVPTPEVGMFRKIYMSKRKNLDP